MIRFGDFLLHQDERRLWKKQVEVRLTPKAMELLVYLALRPGQVVLKEELFKALWPDTFVGDHALSVQIREIRKVLGEPDGERSFIETRHRRGYRFVPQSGGVLDEPEPPNPPPSPRPMPVEKAASSSPPFSPPQTSYARSGDVNIAYQVLGSGSVDIVFVMGWVSHLEYFWTEPHFAAFLRRRFTNWSPITRNTTSRRLAPAACFRRCWSSIVNSSSRRCWSSADIACSRRASTCRSAN